jgi:hypothetical protein
MDILVITMRVYRGYYRVGDICRDSFSQGGF